MTMPLAVWSDRGIRTHGGEISRRDRRRLVRWSRGGAHKRQLVDGRLSRLFSGPASCPGRGALPDGLDALLLVDRLRLTKEIRQDAWYPRSIR